MLSVIHILQLSVRSVNGEILYKEQSKLFKLNSYFFWKLFFKLLIFAYYIFYNYSIISYTMQNICIILFLGLYFDFFVHGM